jgi:hypothetical protein
MKRDPAHSETDGLFTKPSVFLASIVHENWRLLYLRFLVKKSLCQG